MKLAEALVVRKDLKTRISYLQNRIDRNVVGQEGELPAEDPKELIRELIDVNRQYTEIIQRINKTNTLSHIEEELTIGDAIVQRDNLMQLTSILRSVAASASVTSDRYSLSEIRNISYIDVKDLQSTIDDYAKKARDLDIAIQGANWTVELI